MPTYQYACTDAECGDRFELVQSFTDPAATDCPTCGARVRKVFSSVGVVFKGPGFYRTDSREAAKPASPKKASADAPKTTETKSSDTPAPAAAGQGGSTGSAKAAAAPVAS